MILCVTDIETTGLEPSLHEIIEIGAVLYDTETREVVDTFEMKVIPMRPEEGSKEAYEVNGYSERKWKYAMPLDIAMQWYVEFAQGSSFCSWNMLFDYPFLERAALNSGLKLPFNHRQRYDAPSMVFGLSGMENKGLKKACVAFGIKPEPKVHRAINGAERCLAIVSQLI